MLLCDTCHRRIDEEEVEAHPVALLAEYKQEHELRIETVTGIDYRRKTYIVAYAAKVGERDGDVTHDQARIAVLRNGWYPATNSIIALNTTEAAQGDDSPAFWQTECTNIDAFVQGRLTGHGPDGRPMEHLSVFALAPMPLLVYFGRKLGDIVPVEIYQRHRDTEDWVWRDAEEPDFRYITERVIPGAPGIQDVVLELSLSDALDPACITAAAPAGAAWYKFTIERPHRDFLKTPEQWRLFGEEYGQLLSQIRADLGANCTIHLFPAVPVSIALQIGRMSLPKSDASMAVYDFNRQCGGWMKALDL